MGWGDERLGCCSGKWIGARNPVSGGQKPGFWEDLGGKEGMSATRFLIQWE